MFVVRQSGHVMDLVFVKACPSVTVQFFDSSRLEVSEVQTCFQYMIQECSADG